MPMDIFVNKERNRINSTLQNQTIKNRKYNPIEVLNKEFYIKTSFIPEGELP